MTSEALRVFATPEEPRNPIKPKLLRGVTHSRCRRGRGRGVCRSLDRFGGWTFLGRSILRCSFCRCGWSVREPVQARQPGARQPEVQEREREQVLGQLAEVPVQGDLE